MFQNKQHRLYSLPMCHFLKSYSVSYRDKTAIIDGVSQETITYGRLYNRIVKIAWWLDQKGIKKGDRVAILSSNSKAEIEFFLALAWIGGVAVPLNIRLNPKELSYIIQDSGSKTIFSDSHHVENAETALSPLSFEGLKILCGEPREGWTPYDSLIQDGLIQDGNGILEMNQDVTGDTLMLMLYTSGTTGKPKGCMLGQRSWTAQAANLAACMKMGCDDVYLGFMPLFHVSGFSATFSQLILGGTVITAPLPDPKFLWGLVEKYKATIANFIPAVSVPFVQYHAGGHTESSSLKVFISGAGAEPPELVDYVEKKMGARYYGIYGQTEAGGFVSWVDGNMIRQLQTSYGVVMPFFEYTIVDQDGLEVGPGVPGELCLRGESIMMGYWNLPEATADTLKNDWLHTGDVFIHLDQGMMQMVDRVKYLIKTGGENVYPQEVEYVLHQHEVIADTAVIGTPDEKWGEAIKAFIVLKEGKTISKSEVAEWVEQNIAGYKKPRYIEFVDIIPRNISGKILKMDLKERETTEEHKV